MSKVMPREEVIHLLKEHVDFDASEFYRGGKIDIQKVFESEAMKFVKEIEMDEAGRIVKLKFFNDRTGYVYFIRAENGFTKIGIANDFEQRLNSLRSSSPVRLELVKVKWVKDAKGVENELHEYFADKRQHGEWFDLSDKDLKSATSLLDGYVSDGD